METKILAAVDGSPFSSHSLDYLTRLFENNASTVIHLFGVISTTGLEQNWMHDVDPLREHSPAVEKKVAQVNRYLKDARERLLHHGFKEEQITFSAAASTADISTTIHHEANKGIYDSLVIGRRGVGMVGEMFLGSVSAYLVEKCHEVPLWIIDGEVKAPHFLLAVECMSKSLLAADHLGFFLKNTAESTIFLYHSKSFFGKKRDFDPDEVRKDWGDDWCTQNLTPNADFMQVHKQVLLDAGIPERRIAALPEQMDVDASHDLIRQARQQNCGTIVIGRRGRDFHKGLLGGVSDRTLKQADNIAVWLVG